VYKDRCGVQKKKVTNERHMSSLVLGISVYPLPNCLQPKSIFSKATAVSPPGYYHCSGPSCPGSICAGPTYPELTGPEPSCHGPADLAPPDWSPAFLSPTHLGSLAQSLAVLGPTTQPPAVLHSPSWAYIPRTRLPWTALPTAQLYWAHLPGAEPNSFGRPTLTS
jgi:hypothetical protein